MQEPRRIILKQTTTQRLSGRTRKVVVNKTEVMYVPLLETLQNQLNSIGIQEEVRIHVYSLYSFSVSRMHNTSMIWGAEFFSRSVVAMRT